MIKGRRLSLALSAQLIWVDGNTDLNVFIETGELGEAASPVMPFNADLRSQIVKEFQRDFGNGKPG